MNVNLSELRKVLNLLIDYVEEQKGNSIEIDDFMYWFVTNDCLCDPYVETPELTLGQIGDDWESLTDILNDGEPIGYALVWASCILRIMGKEVI